MERTNYRDTDCLTARGRSEDPSIQIIQTDLLTTSGTLEHPVVNNEAQLAMAQAALAIHQILNKA